MPVPYQRSNLILTEPKLASSKLLISVALSRWGKAAYWIDLYMDDRIFAHRVVRQWSFLKTSSQEHVHGNDVQIVKAIVGSNRLDVALGTLTERVSRKLDEGWRITGTEIPTPDTQLEDFARELTTLKPKPATAMAVAIEELAQQEKTENPLSGAFRQRLQANLPAKETFVALQKKRRAKASW